MFLEHYGSRKKSNLCVSNFFFAHHGCDNCVKGNDRNVKEQDDRVRTVSDRRLPRISHTEGSLHV